MGFLLLLLPPSRMAALMVPQMWVLLGEGACLSLDWLFPGVIWQKAPRWEGYNPRNLAALPHFLPEGLIFPDANQALQYTAAWKQTLFFLFLEWWKRGIPPDPSFEGPTCWQDLGLGLETRCVASGVPKDLGFLYIHVFCSIPPFHRWHPRLKAWDVYIFQFMIFWQRTKVPGFGVGKMV